MSASRFYGTLFFLFFSVYATSQTSDPKAAVKISGEVTTPLTLFAEDLAKMKQVRVTLKGKDARMHPYTGVSLQDLLAQAGASTGSQLKGENLAKYMLVKCADGYQVVFSLADFDSSFTDRKFALVFTSGGKPLPANEGPFRLVVPGEKKPARSCRQVTELVIRSAKE